MKRIRQLVFCAILWPVMPAIGQDLLPTKIGTPAPTEPANAASLNPTPTPIPSDALGLIPSPLPSPAGAGVVPPTSPDLPDLSQLDQIFKQSALGKEAEEYRAHVEWRQLKNRIVHDPAVVAAKAAAGAASTDLEKRNRLRIYYEIYYARMTALASSPQMVDYLNSMKIAHLNLLVQPRVRPAPEPVKKVER